MFKKIIDAIVAFFTGSATKPVTVAAPYKIETPVESVAVTIAMAAPIVKEPTPALTIVAKPKAVKAKPATKTAVKAVPAAKKAPITKAAPKSTLRKAADVPAKPKAPGRAKPKAVK